MENNTPQISLAEHRRWWILVAIGVGTFMGALDGSVVNMLLPVLRTAFNSDIASIEWVVTIYLLVLSGLLLSFGRLGDLRGHKQVYLWGFGIFIVGSALSGLSGSVRALILFRGFQALGAAMLSANSPAILTKNFPASQRGQALGLQAMMTYLGLVVGPSLGGWLAMQFGWRAVFYINVPIGLLALALSQWFIPTDHATAQKERFDLAGAGLFTVGLIALLLGLNQGHAWGWSSPATLGTLTVAAALLGGFVSVERHAAAPMLDLNLFCERLFSAATASAVFNYICIYSIIFLMPFYLIQGRELNPAEAGALLTMQPIIMAIAAPISGALSDKIGSRLLSTLGMVILAGALFLYSRLQATTPLFQVGLTLALSGLGTGIFISPNTSALMGAAPRHRQGIAAGIQATARNIGMALGVGITGAIFTTILSRDSATLFDATRGSFLLIIGVAVLGVLTSATRGEHIREA